MEESLTKMECESIGLNGICGKDAEYVVGGKEFFCRHCLAEMKKDCFTLTGFKFNSEVTKLL